MKLYGLKNCDTCRRALKSLKSAGYAVTFVDVRVDGVSTEDLRRFYDTFGTSLVNWKSTTWRGLSDAQREDEPVSLLAAHPALMKRPVIESEKGLSLGWSKEIEEKFS